MYKRATLGVFNAVQRGGTRGLNTDGEHVAVVRGSAGTAALLLVFVIIIPWLAGLGGLRRVAGSGGAALTRRSTIAAQRRAPEFAATHRTALFDLRHRGHSITRAAVSLSLASLMTDGARIEKIITEGNVPKLGARRQGVGVGIFLRNGFALRYHEKVVGGGQWIRQPRRTFF
jgi:hypothetical protein